MPRPNETHIELRVNLRLLQFGFTTCRLCNQSWKGLIMLSWGVRGGRTLMSADCWNVHYWSHVRTRVFAYLHRLDWQHVYTSEHCLPFSHTSKAAAVGAGGRGGGAEGVLAVALTLPHHSCRPIIIDWALPLSSHINQAVLRSRTLCPQQGRP